jgi:hypothetical protein
LAVCQVSDELAEFISSVDEICAVDNFAKNEGIFLGCHITLLSVTPNGVIGKVLKEASITPIGVTPNGATHASRLPMQTRTRFRF